MRVLRVRLPTRLPLGLLLGLLASPLLAGCGIWGSQDNSPEGQCRRQAYDDPTVKSLTVESLGQSADNPDSDYQYNVALRAATQKCLQQKGIATRGGVEPVRSQ
jgi:hypothetical protein